MMPELKEPFHEAGRQVEADRLGMLVFLASEAMLFGGLFTAALAMRVLHPQDYAAAASHLKLWLGTANTAVLLTSSLAAALAVEWARAGRPRAAGWALGSAVLLGLVFLSVKGSEYRREYTEGLLPGFANVRFENHFEQLFMNFYFTATVLHAVHVSIGIVLLAVAGLRRSAREDRETVLIGNVALYWHLVDVIWVFLYATLYLAAVR